MTDKQLDDLFRKRLDQHSSNVPDDMWSRIATDDKKKKRTFILTGSVLFLLLVFTAGICWHIFTNNDNEINKTKTVQQGSNNIRVGEKQKTVEKLMRQKNGGSLANKLSFSAPPSNKLNMAFKKYDDKRSKASDHHSIVNDIEDNNRFNDNGVKIADNTTDGNNNRSRDELNGLEAGIAKDSIGPKGLVDTITENEKGDTEESTNDKIAIEIYASPQLPFFEITSGNNVYENVLKNASRARFSYNMGARFSVFITKELSAKIGVQVDLINQKVTFEDSALSTTSNYNNHYKSISIPLLLTYKMAGQRMLNVSFTSGILLNVHSSYKGAIPSVYGHAINIATMNVYNSNTGVSIYVSTSLSKEVSKKISLFAEPYFCYQIKNMAGNLQPFKQRTNTAGISFRIKHNLFGLTK